jgi:replicative DNA helicase
MHAGPPGAHLPSDIEAELSLLGSLIRNNAAIPEAMRLLRIEDFFRDQHRTIFDSIRILHLAGKPVDLSILHDALHGAGALEKAGGDSYLFNLVDNVPVPGNAVHYARIIRRKSLEREGIRLAASIANSLLSGDGLNGSIHRLAEVREELVAVEEGVSRKRGPRLLPEIAREAEELRRLPSIPSAIPGLDEIIGTGGYRVGWLVIPAAFTGGGKTTFLVREALHKGYAGHPVLYITAELSAAEVHNKIMDSHAIDRMTGAPEPKIWIDDDNVTLSSMEYTIREWARALPKSDLPPVVCIDYLQKIQTVGQHNREREVAVVAETVQRLSRKLGLITIGAAQLNRMSQEDEPEIWHLRESGLLEQAADLVLLTSRNGTDQMRVKVGKNRWGLSDGRLDLGIDWAHCSFGTLRPEQVYAELINSIIEYLNAHEGRAPLRQVCRSIRYNGDHPKRNDIWEASRASNRFVFEDDEVVLIPQNP